MLTDEQRATLTAEAKRRGVDADELIAAAESLKGDPGKPKSTAEKPKMFMYLLPFVTVREVRQNWLELTDSFPGDDMPAAEWAAKFGASSATKPGDEAA